MELKTSDEWLEIFPGVIILDPDGWDRQNYKFSFYEEKITLDEFKRRLYNSTISSLRPFNELGDM